MKDLVEYIVKQIVSNPDDVLVEEQRSEEGVNLLLTVNPADMGMVIGKAGQTIKSIRKLVTIVAMNENVRANLQLNDPQAVQSSEAPQEEAVVAE